MNQNLFLIRANIFSPPDGHFGQILQSFGFSFRAFLTCMYIFDNFPTYSRLSNAFIGSLNGREIMEQTTHYTRINWRK